jgi:hypothetical protein
VKFSLVLLSLHYLLIGLLPAIEHFEDFVVLQQVRKRQVFDVERFCNRKRARVWLK